MLFDNWLLMGLVAIAAMAILVGVGFKLRAKTDDSNWALREIAIDSLQAVLVPDGMDGHIHLEYLLLTARGLVIVDVKPYEGVVFASDRMEEWTVMTGNRRHAFPNPQGSLYDRIAAVKQLLLGVPVYGHILFPGAADFSKGRPKDVILPPELLERYKKPDRAEAERLTEAYWPHWERIRESVHS